VTLSDYNDKQRLHALFADKGFEKYTKEELASRQTRKEEREKADVREMEAARTKRREENIAKGMKLKDGKGSNLRAGGKMERQLRGGGRNNNMNNMDMNMEQRLKKEAMARLSKKEKLQQLKKAREDYMTVGMPIDKKSQ